MANKNVRIRYNDKVKLTDGGQGTVKYIGEVIGKKGVFYGVDLLKGTGKNNGKFKGQIYFKTRGNKKCGKFVKNTAFRKVTKTVYSTKFTVGDLVFVKSKGNGTIRYVGIPSFSQTANPMYGIQLNEPNGLCDGTFKKAKYFSAQTKFGIYAEQYKVQKPKASADEQYNSTKNSLKKVKSKKTTLIVTVDSDTNHKDSKQKTKRKRKRKRKKIEKQRYSSCMDVPVITPFDSNSSNPSNAYEKISQQKHRLSHRLSNRLSRLYVNAHKVEFSNLQIDAYSNLTLDYSPILTACSASPSNVSVNSFSEESLFDEMSDSESRSTSAISPLEETWVIDDTIIEKGYENIKNIYTTFKYELLTAEIDDGNENENKNVKSTDFTKVVIKKVANTLNMNNNNEYEEEEGDKEEENENNNEEIDLVKEALILEHLTISNQCNNNYIVKFTDFFDSEKHLYLATEDYMENSMNLHQFVTKAHKHIENGKLKLKEYQKVIKYILWEIIITLYWLHNDMSCCHLNIQPKNIWLMDSEFIVSNEFVSINPSISIKITGFGRSEMFNNNIFICNKGPSLDFIEYVSPQLYLGQSYDARKSDLWALGLMCYYCYVGNPLFVAFDDDDSDRPEYWSPQKTTLKQYVIKQNLKKYIHPKVVSFLENILKIDEDERYLIEDIVNHQWLASYYKKYKFQITQKSKTQKVRLKKQQDKMSSFPFYENESVEINDENIESNEYNEDSN